MRHAIGHQSLRPHLAASPRRLGRLLVCCVVAVGTVIVAASSAHAATDRVLILDETVSGGASSPEGQAAVALGFEVDVVDDARWRAMTAADFAAYRAIVLGDPTCGATSPAAAVDTTNVWGPELDGNVMIVGSDPTYHGARGLIDAAIRYATAQPGKTGAYITLSCYNHGAPERTAVPLLDGLSAGGSFSVRGVGCYNDAHITAADSALSDLEDSDLSNWSCSVHEGFDGYPTDFVVLAIARDIGETYTAPDGSVGTPYILARGSGTSYVGRNYVALGDSVSAGEGIGYDFRWDDDAGHWVRHGTAAGEWDTAFTTSDCHQTADAHPRVAAGLVSANLTHLACTGSTARNGVLGGRHDDADSWTAPAQLGWTGTGQSGLAAANDAYDDAQPDVVSISLGANDVGFGDLVSNCYQYRCSTDRERLDDVLDDQRRNLRLVMEEIRRRAPAGKQPLVVLTRYVDPFPATWTDKCTDLDIPVWAMALTKKEMDFLRDGLNRLNVGLYDIADDFGAVVLTPSSKFKQHVFCTEDPWVFGPSIRARSGLFGPDKNSKAPFHPTSAGQAEIGAQMAELFKAKLPLRAGNDVRVTLPAGRLTFSSVTQAGEAFILPAAQLQGFPLPDSFRQLAGFEIGTSAPYAGTIQVSLPSSQPVALFHYVNGQWQKVPSTYNNGYVTGEVSSLSPFALGEPVSPVTAAVAPVAGGRAPVTAKFDATGSAVEDGSAISEYHWDFGDGAVAVGSTPTHTYDQSGHYTVSLQVTAANGAVDSTTTEVTVTNAAPAALLSGPMTAIAGRPVALDGSGSTDPNGDVVQWAWDFGDADDPASAPMSGQRVTHTFAKPGVYTVRLEVADNEGEPASAQMSITVQAAKSDDGTGPAGGGSTPVGGASGPPQTSAPAAGTRAPAVPARLAMTLGTVRFDGRGRLLIPLRCAAGRSRCSGTVTARVRSRRRTLVLAQGRVALAAGTKKTLPLAARVRTLRAVRGTRLKITITIQLIDGQRVVASKSLSRPRRR